MGIGKRDDLKNAAFLEELSVYFVSVGKVRHRPFFRHQASMGIVGRSLSEAFSWSRDC